MKINKPNLLFNRVFRIWFRFASETILKVGSYAGSGCTGCTRFGSKPVCSLGFNKTILFWKKSNFDLPIQNDLNRLKITLANMVF